MPPKKVKLLPSELLSLLEAERRTFSEDLHDLTDSQRKQYDSCVSLFHTDDSGFSRQRCYTRGRARSFLTDVYKAVGADALLLSILAAAISRLGTVSSKDAVPVIRDWWLTVSHPRCLTTIAMPVPAALGLADAPHDPPAPADPLPANPQINLQITPPLHQPPPPVDPQTAPQLNLPGNPPVNPLVNPLANPLATPLANPLVNPPPITQPISQSITQAITQPITQQQITPQITPQISPDINQPINQEVDPQTLVPLIRPPRVSHQDLTYLELLGFFETHLRSSHLRLTCPLAAPPSLHLDLGTAQGGNAVIQFSIGGGEALIEYLRTSRESRLQQ